MTDKPENSKPKTRRAVFTCLMVVTVLFSLLIVGLYCLGLYVRSQFSAIELARMNEYDTRIVQLPPDWYKPVKLPPVETVKALFDLSATTKYFHNQPEHSAIISDSHRSKIWFKLRNVQSLSDDEQTSLTVLLADLQPLIDQTSATVFSKGYSAELGSYDPFSFGLNELFWLNQYLNMASTSAAQDGDYSKVLDILELEFRLVKRPAQASTFTHSSCMMCLYSAFNSISLLAQNCTDPTVLKHGLKMYTDHRKDVFPGDPELWKFGATFGAFCRIAADGYPIKLIPQTAAEAYKRINSITQNKAYYEWVLDNLPAGDLRREKAQLVLNALKTSYNSRWKDRLSQSIIGETGFRIVAGCSSGAYYWEVLTKDDYLLPMINFNLARFDLTRLALAQRIVELENGETSATATPDLSAYISPIPDDPYSSGTLKYSSRLKRYYSIGPDGKDDGCAIRQEDPSGPYSGDIFFGE